MLLMNQQHAYERESGDCRFRFLPTGDIAEFSCGDTRINCFEGTMAEGSSANIWLRQYHQEVVAAVYPLWGVESNGKLAKDGNDNLFFSGTAGEVRYRLTFMPLPALNAWVWKLWLDVGPDTAFDVVYGQDIGVADRNNVITNELYTAQYLGHRAFETDNGYAVASRQNKPQAAGNRPFLQQGMLRGRAVGYSTDAMQFFGLAYKAGAPAKGLWRDLDNENYQFELSYTALQSERFSLAAPRYLAFYGAFHQDHPEVLTTSLSTAPLEEAFRRVEASAMRWAEVPLRTPRRKGSFGGLFTSREMSEEQIERLWPTRQLEEWGEKGEPWSFFTPGHTHVVLQAKALSCIRPHAHIIMSAPDTQEVRDSCMATTNTMYGVFNAQTVIGNTSMNRLISIHRGLLNQLKNHGQRLWVEIDGQYRLLGLPATYEMGLNWACWRYVLPDGDRLVVSGFAAAHSAGIVLEVRCEKERDMLLSTQLVMGNEHPPNAVEAHWHGRVLRVRQPEHMRADSPYPGLHYDLHFQEIPDETGDDGVFFEDGVGCSHTLLTCTFRKRTGFTLTIVGALEDAPTATEAAFDFHAERKAWEKVHSDFTVGLRIGATRPSMLRKAQQLDHTAWWFAHNALVHFASPHGLEQTNGAAWGTRDVCQGPFEFFMSTGHFALARHLLLRVFAHQLHGTGEWPQWFMFDRYAGHAPECHGDVVFWPLKCLAAYITATDDEDILLSSVPWQGSSARAPLANHLGKALAAIETRFFSGTWLISYAGGDWNDTLQPANSELRRELVSSWTQALAAETMRLLADSLSQRLPGLAGRCRLYAKGMADDFMNKLIDGGVVMGLARVRADGKMIPLLHPRDTETGIHYRLLPHIQSILSGIVTREQEAANLDIIKEHLLLPDGVRLMDRPVRYTGGNSHLFQRAEQDANVGRESGLMYAHAHIRYVETLVKSGHSDLAWEALFYVVPSAMREIIPSAAPRQSNVYFSSSDALFLDRFDFQERYTLLKNGRIPLLGGWRLYSSGPGLWFALLLRDIFGIRIKPECVTVSDDSNGMTTGLEISLCYSDEEYRITL